MPWVRLDVGGYLQPLGMFGAGQAHRLVTPLQVIQQRAVGVGELPAEMDTRLEQAGGPPAVEGALADAQVVRCSALDGPGEGRGHGGSTR